MPFPGRSARGAAADRHFPTGASASPGPMAGTPGAANRSSTDTRGGGGAEAGFPAGERKEHPAERGGADKRAPREKRESGRKEGDWEGTLAHHRESWVGVVRSSGPRNPNLGGRGFAKSTGAGARHANFLAGNRPGRRGGPNLSSRDRAPCAYASPGPNRCERTFSGG